MSITHSSCVCTIVLNNRHARFQCHNAQTAALRAVMAADRALSEAQEAAALARRESKGRGTINNTKAAVVDAVEATKKAVEGLLEKVTAGPVAKAIGEAKLDDVDELQAEVLAAWANLTMAATAHKLASDGHAAVKESVKAQVGWHASGFACCCKLRDLLNSMRCCCHGPLKP